MNKKKSLEKKISKIIENNLIIKKKITEKTDLITKETPKPKKTEVPKSDTSIEKTPKIIDSEKKLVVTKPSTTIPKDPSYTIQVFASRKHENAKILVEKLKRSGFDDAFIFKHSAGGNPLYRVRVGKVERSKTKDLAEKLKKLKYIQSVQVTRF